MKSHFAPVVDYLKMQNVYVSGTSDEFLQFFFILISFMFIPHVQLKDARTRVNVIVGNPQDVKTSFLEARLKVA